MNDPNPSDMQLINQTIKAEVTAFDAQGNPLYNLNGEQVTKI